MRKELEQILKTVEQYPQSFFCPKRKKRELVQLLRTQILDKLNNDLDQIETRLPNLEKSLSDKMQEIEHLSDQNGQIKQEVASLSDKNEQMEQKIAELSAHNAQITDEKTALQLKHKIIALLLNSRNQNEGLKQYFHLLHHDFLAFANEESSLVEEAAALLKLQELGKELELVSNYPDFHHKHTLAVAGGFSAGKSAFISSLFGDQAVKLPSDVKPTTAIPTYVMSGGQNRLLGVSSQGGVVDLHQIDEALHSKLSHEFINGFGFNLKSILPNLFLTTKLEFEHLCFIDTPGYNAAASGSGFTDEDVQTAKDFTQQAEAVLWLIGLDANGTISETDCEFLSEIMQEQEKPLYIVLNKADLKPLSDVEDIMETVVEYLEDYNIEFAGVSAYSARLKKELTYFKQPIMQFIKNLDKPSDKHRELLKKLYEVDLMYQKAILADIEEYQSLAKTFKTLALDLYEQDVEEETYNKVDKLRKRFETGEMEKQLKKLGVVIEKLRTAIDSVFGRPLKFERVVLNNKNYKKAVDLETVIQQSKDADIESRWYNPFIWGDDSTNKQTNKQINKKTNTNNTDTYGSKKTEATKKYNGLQMMPNGFLIAHNGRLFNPRFFQKKELARLKLK